MAIWFSSDWHFNHKNIAGPIISSWPRGYRDFDSIEAMNDTIINNLNSKIDPQDSIYFLGDFLFGDKEQIHSLRCRINCDRIHLIYGNHDYAIRKHWEYRGYFEWCRDYFELRSHKTAFILSHYAMRVWNFSHHGSIHLYGHSHGTLPDAGNRSMDVGVDCVYPEIKTERYMPFHIDEVYDFLSKRSAHSVDHHNMETTQ